MAINSTQVLERQPFSGGMVSQRAFSLPRFLGLFGVLPVSLAITLLIYSLNNGWLSGIVFAVSWIVHVAVFWGLIYWVNRRDDIRNEQAYKS